MLNLLYMTHGVLSKCYSMNTRTIAIMIFSFSGKGQATKHALQWVYFRRNVCLP